MSDWTEKYHLRPTMRVGTRSQRWYIAIAYSNYKIYRHIVDLGYEPPRLYLWDILNEIMTSPPIFKEDLLGISVMTDAEIANEILMGSPIAAARERLLEKYGEYRYEGSLIKEGQ